jgi:signal transduction histidine kinase
MTWFNRLHLRIMLPFVGLILAVGLLSLLLSRHALGRLMDQRQELQSQRISRVLSNAQFVFNPIYLEKLRDAIDNEIVVFAVDGTVKATTLDSLMLRRITGAVDPVRLFDQLAGAQQDTLQQTVSEGGHPFLVTARILNDPTDSEQRMMLWVLADMADAQSLLSTFTARLLLVGAGGILLVLILGYLIARSVSRPVDDLIAVTGQIADGRFDRQAELPDVEELRVLALAVNAMSCKLGDYRDQVARSSRLAAAGKITAAMAHEIKNPLSSVKMLVQLLRDRLDDTPENGEIVRSILEEIVRLERIVGDLSNRVRPTTITLEITDLNRLIDQLIPVIRPKLAHRKITLRTGYQDDLPQLMVDRDKIKQVLWNLLLNAMESMPAGGTVSVLTMRDPTGRACICIEDQGGGIDSAQRDALFDPFFTTKPEGLGLGLSTSREIIAAHGGTLTLENMPAAGGVRATIALPIQTKENVTNGEDTDRR